MCSLVGRLKGTGSNEEADRDRADFAIGQRAAASQDMEETLS